MQLFENRDSFMVLVSLNVLCLPTYRDSEPITAETFKADRNRVLKAVENP